jgi:hypothetical protein
MHRRVLAESRVRAAGKFDKYVRVRALLALQGVGTDGESAGHCNSMTVIIAAVTVQSTHGSLYGLFTGSVREGTDSSAQRESRKREGAAHAGT